MLVQRAHGPAPVPVGSGFCAGHMLCIFWLHDVMVFLVFEDPSRLEPRGGEQQQWVDVVRGFIRDLHFIARRL